MGYKRFVILVVDVSSELNLILFASCEIIKQQSYTLINISVDRIMVAA